MKITDLDFDEKKNKLSPKDRVPMIEEVFKLVLNRKPSSRELSYYKYGNQNREEIIEKLLENDEHKEALEDYKELPTVQDQLKKSENQVKRLNQRIEDSKEESIQLKNLLNEKNKEIAILRREKEDPYNFTHAEALTYIKNISENNRNNVSTSNNINNETAHFSTLGQNLDKKESFLDKVYRIIKS